MISTPMMFLIFVIFVMLFLIGIFIYRKFSVGPQGEQESWFEEFATKKIFVDDMEHDILGVMSPSGKDEKGEHVNISLRPTGSGPFSNKNLIPLFDVPSYAITNPTPMDKRCVNDTHIMRIMPYTTKAKNNIFLPYIHHIKELEHENLDMKEKFLKLQHDSMIGKDKDFLMQEINQYASAIRKMIGKDMVKHEEVIGFMPGEQQPVASSLNKQEGGQQQ